MAHHVVRTRQEVDDSILFRLGLLLGIGPRKATLSDYRDWCASTLNNAEQDLPSIIGVTSERDQMEHHEY